MLWISLSLHISGAWRNRDVDAIDGGYSMLGAIKVSGKDIRKAFFIDLADLFEDQFFVIVHCVRG